MSSRTRSGMERARDAAWTAFGLRFWKWFVAAAFIRRVLPFLAVAATVGLLLGGAWWGIGHLRGGEPGPAPTRTPLPGQAAQPQPVGWDVLPGPGWLWALVPAVLALAAFGAAYAHTPIPVWHRPGGVRSLSLAVVGAGIAGVLLFLVGGR